MFINYAVLFSSEDWAMLNTVRVLQYRDDAIANCATVSYCMLVYTIVHPLYGGGLAQLVAMLVRSTKLAYSTPGPVSTGIGDRIVVQLLVWEIYLSLTNNPGQLSLAIPPRVGAMSTGQRAVMFCDWE